MQGENEGIKKITMEDDKLLLEAVVVVVWLLIIVIVKKLKLNHNQILREKQKVLRTLN